MRELYNDNEFYLKKKYGSELNYKLWLFGGFTRLLVENLFIISKCLESFPLIVKDFIVIFFSVEWIEGLRIRIFNISHINKKNRVYFFLWSPQIIKFKILVVDKKIIDLNDNIKRK